MAKDKKCVAFIKATGQQCWRPAKHVNEGKTVCGLHKTWVGSRENIAAALAFRKHYVAALARQRHEESMLEFAANADAAETQRSCLNCEHGVIIENGYSNYTVEGSDFYCSLEKHPQDGFDLWYGEDARLRFASNCEKFSEGDNMNLDVERQDIDELNDAAKALFAVRNY